MGIDWRQRRDEGVPLELWEVLAQEFETHGHEIPSDFDELAEAAIVAKQKLVEKDTADTCAAWEAAKSAAESRLFGLFHETPRTALCFSGGGVRSATFGLGVLQGLAGMLPCKPLLPVFDFLSTVSGGGYVGSWFSSWAARAPGGSQEACEKIAARPAVTLEPEPAPLRHLREYCAFLDPKLGALSADTWTLASTVTRNMILNWLILIPLLMAVLIIPKLYDTGLIQLSAFYTDISKWLLLAGFITGVLGSGYILASLPGFKGSCKYGDREFFWSGLLPLTASALLLPLAWSWRFGTTLANYSALEFALFGAAMHLGGVILAFAWKRSERFAGLAVVSVLSGALAGWLVYLVSTIFAGKLNDSLSFAGFQIGYRHLFVCFAIPLVITSFAFASMLAVGFASRFTFDNDREWWARAGGWLLMVVVCWVVFSGAVIYAPVWLSGTVQKLVAVAGAGGLGGLASRLGFSSSTAAGRREEDKDNTAKRTSPFADLTTALIGPAFLLLLIALLSMVDDAIIHNLYDWASFLPGLQAESASATYVPSEFYLLFATLLTAFVSSWFININRFSLHAMYRNRLIRTYLGASHSDRVKTVNRFTDMDEGDNIPMKTMRTKPLHVVNMALNLVAGKNLAWQERKAESFTASALHTGSLRLGYQKTSAYGGPRGLSLGGAVAISGAAASPNMGYHSSPLLTFVMTLFNARLGWWLANPGAPGKGAWKSDGPKIAFLPIVAEAMGQTTDDKKWIYLSDGGHFENLALYEMVLRRCRTIVVVDGGEDHEYTFEDLGNACRKIRVDFGISIEFNRPMPMSKIKDPNNRYCAIGDIRYDLADKPASPDRKIERGKLLYIKACLNGSEPLDVLHYAASNSDFPQQGTEQLWFNESQFESYRRLGLHAIEKIWSCLKEVTAGTELEHFCQAAEAHITETQAAG